MLTHGDVSHGCATFGGLGERGIDVGQQLSWVLPATGSYFAGPVRRRLMTASVWPALFEKRNGPTQATDFR